MQIIFENSSYTVEYHPAAPVPYWVVNKRANIHGEEHFYDEERAINYAQEQESKGEENAAYYLEYWARKGWI